MLKFKALSCEVEELHLKTLGKRFDEVLNHWTELDDYPACATKLRKRLKDRRRDILVGGVQELRSVIDQVEDDAPDLLKYLAKRPRGKKRKDHPQMELLIKKLNELFNYAKFDDKDDGWNAYKLVAQHSLRICPYCHMNHVNYHEQRAKNSGELELRPPLDHFLPQSIYPYLAVSLYNLIPCCDRCNSTTIKGAKDPKQTIPHPFDDSALRMSFKVEGSALGIHGLTDEELGLSVTGDGAWQNFAEFFRLQERYQWHRAEMNDMLQRIQTLEESDVVLEKLMIRPLFILGFAPHDVEKRALGICLLDIAKNLKAL